MKKYPIASIALTPVEAGLFKEIAKVRQEGYTTMPKNILYEEFMKIYYEQEWDRLLNEYMTSQDVTTLDPDLGSVFLSKTAKDQFEEKSTEFQLIFTGWLKTQLKQENAPLVSGSRYSDKPTQWIYRLGNLHALAYIPDFKKVIILGFGDKTRVEILQEILRMTEEI